MKTFSQRKEKQIDDITKYKLKDMLGYPEAIVSAMVACNDGKLEDVIEIRVIDLIELKNEVDMLRRKCSNLETNIDNLVVHSGRIQRNNELGFTFS